MSGIVRPPALDLANRDLVESHLHAVWLAEVRRASSRPISPTSSISTGPALPVQQDIADRLCRSELTARSAQSMRRILDSIDAELTLGGGALGESTGRRSPHSIAASAAATLLGGIRPLAAALRGRPRAAEEANRRSEMHGLSAAERKEAKIQQAQANEQIALLERARRAAARTSTPTAISRPKAFCRATIPAAAALRLRAGRAGGGPQGRLSCSARASSPSPSSARAA